ncbi:MAG: alpha/beta hydrolase [Acidobacteriota bacterium]
MSLAQLRLLKRFLDAGQPDIPRPIADLRRGFEGFLIRLPGIDEVEVEATEIGGVPAEWVDARADRSNPSAARILYLHGGGFVLGSVRSHRQLAARLSRAANARCLVLGYRLAPEHPYPAALEDATAAYSVLSAEASSGPLALAGDSAGGGLAILVAAQARRDGLTLPAALLCMSPWVDYAGHTPSLDRNAALDPSIQRPGIERMARLYLAGADPDAPEVSPLRCSHTELPPTLVQAGGDETLLDDAHALTAALEAAGVAVELEVTPGMIHVWQLFAGRLDEGREAIERAGAFLNSHLLAARRANVSRETTPSAPAQGALA